MLIFLQYHGGGSPAGHQAVSVTVEGPAGLERIRGFFRKGAQSVEGSHGVAIDLLGASAQYHILHSILDEEIAQADGMAAAGTGGAYGKVDPFQTEDGAEIHGHRGVHGLEDNRLPQHLGIACLLHDFFGLDDRLGR